MRTHLRTATGVLLAALLWGVGVSAAEGSQTEVAWATIRDGVFADQAKWQARFAELDPENRNQVRKLRRLIRDQLVVIGDVGIEQRPQGLPRLFCLYEAAYTAREAAMELNDALAVALEGHPRGFREPFRRGQQMVREYWALRDGVDCSTAGEVTAFQ
ncbi:MAG: hypothetical protein PVH07_10410, partial [Chloroflexota bacterium]